MIRRGGGGIASGASGGASGGIGATGAACDGLTKQCTTAAASFLATRSLKASRFG